MHDPDPPVDYPERNRVEREYDKAVIKEALKEWLDDKFLTFGKWSLGSLAAAALALIVYAILTSQGWKPPI